MAKPSLQQVFGTNAVQTSTTLTISKADLSSVGLTPTASNTAESLFAAILFLAKNSLTIANQDINPEQSISVADQDFDFQSLVSRNNQTYRQTTYTARLQKLDINTTPDPDDF